ncbi:hypothetical protein CDAR_463861 [Caerostris darwini]|uniref:Uncharacterized protein n=1 Tax=Caerostris darwini TaxID=1538125 RepID=A0AAV4RUF3_9ARAC|nr:hypothetical protein CDAR_463861 [Caerostris darwini]
MASTLTTVFFIALCLTQNTGCYADCCKSANCEKQSNMWESVKETASQAATSDLLIYGLKTATVAGTVIAGVPLLVSAAGFGAGGIAAGSIAAAVQGTWFGGSLAGLTGTAFAGLQSIGAAGLGIGAKTAIVTASSAVVKAYEKLTSAPAPEEECQKHCPDPETSSWFPSIFGEKEAKPCCSESKSKSWIPSFF